VSMKVPMIIMSSTIPTMNMLGVFNTDISPFATVVGMFSKAIIHPKRDATLMTNITNPVVIAASTRIFGISLTFEPLAK